MLGCLFCSKDGRPEIYLKREDLNHTGAHKINNSLGQALLCRRMGKKRVIAETGAGQHGVATVSLRAIILSLTRAFSTYLPVKVGTYSPEQLSV